MDRSTLLKHIRDTRYAPRDQKKAKKDARRIAEFLQHEYRAEVIGIGSLFESPRDFRANSDIDLVVKNLPPRLFIEAYERADAMSSFDVNLIPWESANDLMKEITSTRGVHL